MALTPISPVGDDHMQLSPLRQEEAARPYPAACATAFVRLAAGGLIRLGYRLSNTPSEPLSTRNHRLV